MTGQYCHHNNTNSDLTRLIIVFILVELLLFFLLSLVLVSFQSRTDYFNVFFTGQHIDAVVTTVPGIHWIAVWSLHVLIVPVWVLSRYSDFLPQSKDRHVKSLCVSRVIDWRPVSVVPHVSMRQVKWAAAQHPRSGNERVSSVLLCLGMTVNLCQLFSLLCNTHS